MVVASEAAALIASASALSIAVPMFVVWPPMTRVAALRLPLKTALPFASRVNCVESTSKVFDLNLIVPLWISTECVSAANFVLTSVFPTFVARPVSVYELA